jgi:hypothetical protein
MFEVGLASYARLDLRAETLCIHRQQALWV